MRSLVISRRNVYAGNDQRLGIHLIIQGHGLQQSKR